jgi:hypothetical protein
MSIVDLSVLVPFTLVSFFLLFSHFALHSSTRYPNSKGQEKVNILDNMNQIPAFLACFVLVGDKTDISRPDPKDPVRKCDIACFG